MVQRSAFLIFLLLAVSAATFVQGQTSHAQYFPPDAQATGDLSYPANSSVSGVVAAAVDLDGAGKVKSIDTLRDIPSLTASVLLSVATWTFTPATFDGKGVDSTIVVDIVFNPGDYQRAGGSTPVLGRELNVLAPDNTGFLPPTVVSAPWAG